MNDRSEPALRVAESADAVAVGRLLDDFNREFGEPTPGFDWHRHLEFVIDMLRA